MNKSTPALSLYFTASLMCVLSVAFQWDSMIILLFKPMIFPAIYFYYWQESSFRPYLLSSLVLLFFYVGDMIVLIDSQNVVLPIMLLNLSAYLILVYSVGKDLLGIGKPEISNFMILSFSIPVIFLLGLIYIALSLVFNASDTTYFSLMVLYGVVLAMLSITIITYYILKNNTAGFFILTAVFCLITSDLFHILYNYYEQFHLFTIINVFCQIISFYFIVKYFLYKSHYNLVLSHDEE